MARLRRSLPAIDRAEGRRLFGADPALYHAARPEYPERVYALLADRCRLAAGTRVFEVGPGPGQVTMRLLRTGARVVAIEPNGALAEHLAAAAKRAGLEVDVQVTSFEEARLPSESFDLGVAATSLHWVEHSMGLRKARDLLVPGGWWAMWWNVFNDPNRADPFYEATTSVMRTLARGPSAGDRGRPPFALDVETRTRDLTDAGFANTEVETIPWTAYLDTAQIRALYSTFSPIARLATGERERILNELVAIAEGSFGGRVERAFVTALYTSQRP
jgi:SAM-dependent methyltransferase